MVNKKSTKNAINEKAIELFAISGYEGFSMRTLAKDLNISQSVLYYYYETKDIMLHNLQKEVIKDLASKRSKIIQGDTLYKNLLQRTDFQFENAKQVTFILKYYLHFRDKHEKVDNAYLPNTAYKHILEILISAEKKGEIKNLDLGVQAKIITHTINGFVLEYYPDIPKDGERETLKKQIVDFIYKSLTYKREEVK